MGDHPAQPVYDLDVSAADAAGRLEAGTDMGVDTKGIPTSLTVRKVLQGRLRHHVPRGRAAVIKMEKKVQAGAQFIQTRPSMTPRRSRPS